MVSDAVRGPVLPPPPPDPPDRRPWAFHTSLPGYTPTPLIEADGLSGELGVERLWLKDESSRLGLPAFKIMGAAWAVRHALLERLGTVGEDEPLDDLGKRARAAGVPALVAATDGNHGRAVARMAKLLGLSAVIVIPRDMAEARREALRVEGAEIVEDAGGYDDAVARSARESSARDGVLVCDTAWPGYENVPRAVVDGYSTILWELDDEIAEREERGPDAVVVPVGVGAFAAAVARHYRRPALKDPPVLISVEPEDGACVLASARARRLVTLPEPARSIMSGCNCETPSSLAWPILAGSVDLFVAVDDETAREGMRTLAAAGVAGGECAGGAMGGAVSVLRSAWSSELGLGAAARVLVFVTEGATDPASYERIVGRRPHG